MLKQSRSNANIQSPLSSFFFFMVTHSQPHKQFHIQPSKVNQLWNFFKGNALHSNEWPENFTNQTIGHSHHKAKKREPTNNKKQTCKRIERKNVKETHKKPKHINWLQKLK